MRESLLFIASRFPYPLVGGDRITNYNILRFLSRHYDVHFVAITHTPLERDALDSIAPFCKTCKVFYKSKYRSAFQSLLTLFGKEPLQVGYYYFHDVQHYAQEIVRTHKIQKLLCALVRTAKYANALPIPTKAINMADSLADSSCFVELMLEIIRDSLKELTDARNISDQVSNQDTNQVDASGDLLSTMSHDK